MKSLEEAALKGVIRSLEHRFSQLAVKDQQALLVLAVFLSLSCTYLLVWEPLYSWNTRVLQDYQEQKNTYGWLQANIDSLSSTNTEPVYEEDSESLASVVSATASEVGLSVSRIRPDGAGLRVWVEQASYKQLIPWLIALEKQKLTINQAQFTDTGENGLLTAFLLVGR